MNHHYGKLFGAVVLSSLLSLGTRLPFGSVDDSRFLPTLGQEYADQVGSNINRAGQQIVGRQLQQPPTIEIRPGFAVNVFVNRTWCSSLTRSLGARPTKERRPTMPLRLPHVCVKTVKVPCEFTADLHADLEAYAALFEAERGETIPLPTLIATIVRDYLQRDTDFIRQRRQMAAPRARPKPTASGGTHATPEGAA